MNRRNLIVLLIFLSIGCSPQPPEGPAELIGKGLDQITRGLDMIDPTPTPVSDYRRSFDREEERYREERRRQREFCYDHPGHCMDPDRY